jgi:hypothetical protein
MGFRRSLMRALPALILLALAPPLSPANAQQPDLPGTSASPTGQMALALEKGRITASIRNHPLGAVLEELSSRTGVALIPSPDMDIEALRVSAELAGVTVDEGLRRLLEDFDAFYYYGVVGNRSSSLRAVWIFHKGAAATLRPVPPELWAGTKELQSSLADTDPEVRARGYEALMSRPDRESRELVIQALRGASEPDDAVRERILATAFSTGMSLPRDLLMYLARWDPAERVRLTALNALTFAPTLKEAAEAALTDSSPVVRERAKKILAELEAR